MLAKQQLQREFSLNGHFIFHSSFSLTPPLPYGVMHALKNIERQRKMIFVHLKLFVPL